MPVHQKNSAVYYVSIIIIILFWGCSAERTHKTLTYFFDGVDKTIFFNAYLSTDSISKDAMARRAGLLKKVRPDLCVHKPFREKKCEACHTPDKRLIKPMPQLCYQCHKDFTETYAVVHGPVASGNCTKCHNQHSSKFDKLLTREGQQVCTFCHNASQVFAKKVHRDIEDVNCTLCHSPHGGNSRFMVKNNISKDPNRIALMSELTSRHLYAQIFCKEPGDISGNMEIKIYNTEGILVSISHPDNDGKFILSNLHPDQNYTITFRNAIPDCKINVMDSKGTLLYVIEKKKSKYTFDKSAYESVHEAINNANGNSAYPVNTSISVNSDMPSRKDTVVNKAVIVADNVPEIKNTEEKPGGKLPADTASARGKIVVKELPATETAEEIAARNKKATEAESHEAAGEKADTTVYKGKILVKELPAGETAEEIAARNKKKMHVAVNATTEKADTTVYKGKIIVKSLPGGSARKERNTEVIRKYDQGNTTLVELAAAINAYYPGTNVCVFNDSAECIDIATVNKKGSFLLFDFLAYSITLPETGSGIISQTIFLNDKMEVIEIVNKRVVNGRYVCVPNSREPAGKKANIKLRADKQNAALFTTIYYEQGKALISSTGISELNRVIKYLQEHPGAKVLIAAHTDTRGSKGYNQLLSEERSKATIDYLLQQGIKKDRISGKGYGKSRPNEEYIPTPGLEEAERRNRRVEIYIKDE